MADATSLGSGVADRYAQALFELALEENALDEVAAGIEGLDALIAESADLRRLIASPVFSAAEQEGALGAVMERAGIGGLVANFVRLTAKNRRLFALPGMIAAFRARLARHRGETSAEVIAAQPLSEEQLTTLKEALRASTGKDVRLDLKVDPTLIGGLVVKLGSRMIDSSIRTKLNSLRIVLKEVG